MSRPHRPRTLVAVFSLASLAAMPAARPGVSAQIRASEEGTVSQTVDGTTLSIRYSRPRLRNRTVSEIFGKEVKWGEVWTPGANRATTLKVDKDVTINGAAVPAGAYSVWMVVEDADHWNTVLIPDTMQFHTDHPPVTPEMLQFASPVATIDGSPVRDLTWGVSDLSSTGMTATMAWADRQVALQVRVPPSMPPEIGADRAAPYLGRYTMTWKPGPPPPGWVDTAEITHADSLMTLHWPIWFWPEVSNELLIPVLDDWFTFGVVMDGELFDVIREFTFEFTVKDGRATGFDVRLPDDMILFSGTRATEP